MDQHPLFKELHQICSAHNIDIANAYDTFEVYLELSEAKKLSCLEYCFNKSLKRFYLRGKKKQSDEVPDIYVPVTLHNHLSPKEINMMQQIFCAHQEQFYLIIRDKDSSSTCYKITKSLVKPISPLDDKNVKESEGKRFHFDKRIQNCRKILYSKVLKEPNSL